MLIPRRRTMEMFSISALDLFASALGTFILLAILLFPFYLRQPSLDTELAGARAELAASGESLQDAERTAETQAQRVAQANAALALAREQLEDVQANLLGVIRVLARLSPSLRVGFVAFKDHGAAYVTRDFPLSPMTQDNVLKVVRFVGEMSAEGGGDDPEPVDEALAVATAMDWRADAQGQIVVIGDAPARASGRRHALALAERFRESNLAMPRSVSAIFTGDVPVARMFFEQLARAGGGDFS